MNSNIIYQYHYVYRITNTVENRHYYGKRSSKIEPKLDLGFKYFSSSTLKEFIADQKENPQNYKYKVVAIFDTKEKALEREILLHNMFNVGVNPKFYNKAKQTSTKFDGTGLVSAKNKITGEIFQVSKEEYHLDDNLVGVVKDKVSVKNINTGEIFQVSKEEFDADANLVGCADNTVNALDLVTNIRRQVSKEEFDADANLVGPATGTHHFKSEETKQRMRKPKSAEHAAKIKIHADAMRVKNFVCCLVTRQCYSQNSWTKHFKILYDHGYLMTLGFISSKRMTGLAKSEEHKKALSESKLSKNKIERVCDITNRKEYSMAGFNWKLSREKSKKSGNISNTAL